MKDDFSSSLSALTVDGKQYGVPVSYYQWGIYYRNDIFDTYNLKESRTWDEFLQASATLKKNGITPITIGTKNLWPAAGWFDYLNLRINGFEYHIDVTSGAVLFTDSKLDAVFDTWKDIIKKGYFIENLATYSSQDAIAPMLKGDAAMYLTGNFVVPYFEDAGIKDKLGFFPFPTINANIPRAEDAPIDTAHIPTKAKNKADARKFLAFLIRADIATIMAEGLTQLSPNKNSDVSSDRFLKAGFDILSSAEGGIAQFYDRDTDPRMAKKGMEGFQEFMIKPERESAIRQRLAKEQEKLSH